MKKGYVKPELFYESFVLNQNIAACGIDVHHGSTTTCEPTLDETFWEYYDGDFNVFEGSTEHCKTDINKIEVYCYTSGSNEAGRLFNS